MLGLSSEEKQKLSRWVGQSKGKQNFIRDLVETVNNLVKVKQRKYMQDFLALPPDTKLPWDDMIFKDVWREWIQYRREMGWPKYKAVGYKKAVGRLIKLSSNNSQAAVKIINNAMETGSRGFYPLKTMQTNEQYSEIKSGIRKKYE